MRRSDLNEKEKYFDYFQEELEDYIKVVDGEVEIDYKGSCSRDRYIERDYIDDFIDDLETRLSEAKMLLENIELDSMENIKKAYDLIDDALDDLI